MTTSPKSVKFNFIMNFILTLSNLIFPIITFPYVSRVLQAEGTGRVSFVTSVVAYFAMVGMLGIPSYGIRQTAKVRHDKELLSKTVQEIFLLNTVAMALSTVLYLIAIVSVPRLSEDSTLFYINLATLLFNLLGMDWVYRGLEQYQYIAVRSIAFKIISLILMFMLVQTSDDIIVYGALTILASVGSNFLNFINIRKYITVKKYEHLNIRQHIRPVFSFFMLVVATTVYTNLDVVMLGFMTDNVEVGYYNVAIKIKSILVSLVTSLGTVLLPRLSYYISQKNTKEFERLTKKSIDFIWLSSIPLCVYFVLEAANSILFLSGSGFEGGIVPMQVVMPTLIFIGMSNLIGMQIFVPTDNERYVVESVTIGAIVNVILNAALIPTYGATGAAIGTLVAEFAVTAYQWFKVYDFMSDVVDWKNFAKIIVASMIATIVWLFAPSVASTFMTLLITSVIFFGVYLLVLVVLKETTLLEILSKVWRRKNV